VGRGAAAGGWGELSCTRVAAGLLQLQARGTRCGCRPPPAPWCRRRLQLVPQPMAGRAAKRTACDAAAAARPAPPLPHTLSRSCLMRSSSMTSACSSRARWRTLMPCEARPPQRRPSAPAGCASASHAHARVLAYPQPASQAATQAASQAARRRRPPRAPSSAVAAHAVPAACVLELEPVAQELERGLAGPHGVDHALRRGGRGAERRRALRGGGGRVQGGKWPMARQGGEERGGAGRGRAGSVFGRLGQAGPPHPCGGRCRRAPVQAGAITHEGPLPAEELEQQQRLVHQAPVLCALGQALVDDALRGRRRRRRRLGRR
jgi:hypothetical protein